MAKATKAKKNTEVSLETVLWNCRVALRGVGTTEKNRDAVTKINDHLSHETLIYLRILWMAPFSSLDTWAWEMPRVLATSIWVLPS